MNLLPLEQNAVLTEINKELGFFGYTCLVTVERGVDRRASVYEVLNHINAMFPDLDILFYRIWETAQKFVSEWVNHYAKHGWGVGSSDEKTY